MKYRDKCLLVLLVLFTGLGFLYRPIQAQEPVVRAVLFYSPTCPHCETVINQVIPPLVEKYGTRLQIFGVNTYTEDGSRLFSAAVEAYDIPEERRAVPLLIVKDHVLVGSNEIPNQFPGIIEEGMATGGIDWPAIPGLQEKMDQDNNPSKDPGDSEGTAEEEVVNVDEELTPVDKFTADLAGNVLSTVVLLGMIGTVTYMGLNLKRLPGSAVASLNQWAVPALSFAGLLIALYMSYVEMTQIDAVCGPVGDCNTVQQSSYALLFGVIPVGQLGVLGYILIVLTWVLSRNGPTSWRPRLKRIAWALSLAGTLFSIYLTYLEPFVIGASCLWCLSSAVIMTVLFVLLSGEVSPPLEVGEMEGI